GSPLPRVATRARGRAERLPAPQQDHSDRRDAVRFGELRGLSAVAVLPTWANSAFGALARDSLDDIDPGLAVARVTAFFEGWNFAYQRHRSPAGNTDERGRLR